MKKEPHATAEAEFNTQDMRAIGRADIARLKERAAASPRRRYRICLHHDVSHVTQEMVICLSGFTYFPPHRHPAGHSESYHMVEGVLDVYLLNEAGHITDVVRLAAPGADAARHPERQFMYRLSGPLYHLVVPRSPWTIYHEVLSGPWQRDGVVEVAPFAPDEKHTAAVEAYIAITTGMPIDRLMID